LDSDLKRYIEEFQSIAKNGGQPHNNRFMGSPSHQKTLEYLEGLLNGWGLDTQRQTLETYICSNQYDVENPDDVSTLVVDGEKIESDFMRYTPEETVEGEMVKVHNLGCDEVSRSSTCLSRL
jgi:hypothetical protein